MKKKLINKNLNTMDIAVRLFFFPLFVFALIMKTYDNFFKKKSPTVSKRFREND
ncbi:MAG: hypothetical protein ACRC0S_04745 [Fusobacteriaceae bacterium]